MTKLILASASPRRAELLARLGFPFETMPSGASEEITKALSPTQHVLEIAKRKTQTVASKAQNAIVIGADTVVVINNTILEKPRDADHATEMLTQLSGKTQRVWYSPIHTHPKPIPMWPSHTLPCAPSPLMIFNVMWQQVTH